MPKGLVPDPNPLHQPVGGGENLIPFDEVVIRAKRAGVNFGKGNPLNRLRYYTKIGLLPHAKRKSFGKGSPVGAYPESVIETLVELNEKLASGKNVQAILRENKEGEKPQVPIGGLPPQITFTPIPQVKPPPEKPRVQVPTLDKSPPYEPFPTHVPPKHLLSGVKKGHYLILLLLITLLAAPVLYFANPGFRKSSKDILVYLNSLNPRAAEQQAKKLALPDSVGQVLGTVSDPFLTINVETDVNSLLNARGGIRTYGEDVDANTGRVYASNILYGVQPGTNVAVSTGQNPTISVPNVGIGDITAVLAGSGLSGGGASGGVSLGLTFDSITVSAGAGSTGGGTVSLGGTTVLNIGAGLGITANPNDIEIDLTTSGETGNDVSNSGLEVSTSGLALLRGCIDDEILKWDDDTDVWYCTGDAGGVTGVIRVEQNDAVPPGEAWTGITTLDFALNDFDLITDVDEVDEVDFSIDYANSGITRSGVAETITGGWAFNSDLTVSGANNILMGTGRIDTSAGVNLNIGTTTASSVTIGTGSGDA
jgi:hypothetical protein